MIIYLASPYGFSKQQRRLLIPEIKTKIESFGHEVWDPFERNDQIDFSSPGWAYTIGQKDKYDVFDCDAIFAIVNGTPPDEGVMIELGIVVGMNMTLWRQKGIYLFRDDFRRCTDSEEYPLNLMVFCGLPKDNWRDYYFTSVEDIKLPIGGNYYA